MNFIVENVDWIFSGIGVLFISVIIGFGTKKYIKKFTTKGNNSPIVTGDNNKVTNSDNDKDK